MCAAFASSQEKERDIFRLCAPENGSPVTVGSPVLFGRGYFDALLHLPEGKGGGAVLRQHTECVRLFAAGHPAELEDADTPEALQNLLTQEAALKKALSEAGD